MSLEEMVANINNSLSTLSTAATQQTDPYAEWRAEFAGIPRSNMQSFLGASGPSALFGEMDPEKLSTTRYDYIVSPTGKYLYSNGVIADPATGEFLTPSTAFQADASDVPGSEAWIQKVRTEWSDEKADEWRKKLIDFGIDELVSGGIAESGGKALDLFQGLREYHKVRYLNQGEMVRVRPKDKSAGIKDAVDPVLLREEVKGWGQVPFGEDLAPREADYFADRVIAVASRLAKKKGYAPEQALLGAEARVQKEFLKNENVADAIEETEELEGDTSLRNSIISISQIAGL